MPNTTCYQCGTVNPASQTNCIHCAARLYAKGWRSADEHGARPRANGRARGRRRSTESGPRARKKKATAEVPCFKCKCTLRIGLTAGSTKYRCPKCRTEFKVTRARRSPNVFLVMPELRQFLNDKAGNAPRPQPEEPRTVREALALFGLARSADFAAVGQAYREQMKLYHPDKVAHLGPELQLLAESQTKRINLAYGIVRESYA